MSARVPGLYRVWSWRGDGQLAFWTERGDAYCWCVLDGNDTRGLSEAEVTHVEGPLMQDPPSTEQPPRMSRSRQGLGLLLMVLAFLVVVAVGYVGARMAGVI